MKTEVEVYVIYEETYDPTGKNIRGFVNIVSDAEEALEIIASSDKKLKYFKETIEVDIDAPWEEAERPLVTAPTPRMNICRTWEDCNNPFHDCVNCPLMFRGGNQYTTTYTTTFTDKNSKTGKVK